MLEKAEARSSSALLPSSIPPCLYLAVQPSATHHTLVPPNAAAEQTCAADTQRCETPLAPMCSETCRRLLLCPGNMLPINARISDFSQTLRSDRDREDALPGDGVRQRRWGRRYLMNVADAVGWKKCVRTSRKCVSTDTNTYCLWCRRRTSYSHKNTILHICSWSPEYKTEAQVFISYNICLNTSRKRLPRRSNTLTVA